MSTVRALDDAAEDLICSCDLLVLLAGMISCLSLWQMSPCTWIAVYYASEVVRFLDLSLSALINILHFI